MEHKLKTEKFKQEHLELKSGAWRNRESVKEVVWNEPDIKGRLGLNNKGEWLVQTILAKNKKCAWQYLRNN